MATPPLSIFIKTAPAFFRPGRAQAGAIGRGDLGFACCNAFVFRRSSGATDRSGLSGKSTVLSICGSCHDVGRLTVGYTPEGWRTVVRMMQNFGAPIPPDQVATVTDYLTRSFPEKPRPAATQIEGTIEVGIKQWPVATPGSRPHGARPPAHFFRAGAMGVANARPSLLSVLRRVKVFAKLGRNAPREYGRLSLHRHARGMRGQSGTP
jgi:hypothetical protein